VNTDIFESLKGTFIASLAKLFKPVRHADYVLQCPPVWVRASGAEALFGIKRNFLNDLVSNKKVHAKKADRVVLYRFADIVQAIEEMADFKKGN